MSIDYCRRHDCRWDSDAYRSCPLCEEDDEERKRDAADDMFEALMHAEAVLCVSPLITTNKRGHWQTTTTRIALEKVRAALAKAEGKETIS